MSDLKTLPDHNIGDQVRNIDSDYTFVGRVIARFAKLNGSILYVVENGDGIPLIFSARRLSKWMESGHD